MITCTELNNIPISGRLGNQLWKIAAVIGTADKNNATFCFPEWPYSGFFKHTLPQMPYQQLFTPKLLAFEEKQFHYEPIILDAQWDWNLNGYFQSPKYFENSIDKIKHYFDNIFGFEANDFCAVHIRRGDYLSRPNYHTNLMADYYNRAMKLLPKYTQFIVFSDDIEWCKSNYDEVYFREPEDDIRDLFYMASCRHHIIANSSYSYWGAFLSKQDGITIAPQNWFAPGVGHNLKDLFPAGWLVI